MRVRKLSLSGIERTKLFLGYVGENEHTQIRFDASCIYTDNPGARAGLTMQNPAGTVFPIVLDADGNEIIWNVSASDVAIAGNGSYQLTFTDNDEIIKTFIGQLFVLKSLTSAGDIPTPIENWIDQANQKLAEVEAATESIDNMDASATKLSPDASPTVTVSDVDGHKHLAFGIPQGEKGDKGEKGDTYEVTPENIEEISSRVVQSATIAQYTEGMAEQVEAAQQHASDAGDSATAADSSKKAAAQSAQAASQSATAADTSARNAAQSETNAGNSASAASQSAQAASQSASNAAQSATDAAGSAQDAHDVLDSIPEDYSTLSTDVTNLKSAFAFDTGKQYIGFIKGGYIPNSANVGTEISLTPTANANYSYSIMDCSPNDAVFITGQGSSGARLWSFLNSNNEIISKADASITYAGLVIIAPATTAKVIINTISASEGICYIEKLNKKVEFINGAYIRNDGAVGSVVTLIPTLNAPYSYAVCACAENDVVYITGKGSSSARLWSFLNASNQIISQAIINAENETVTVPANTTKVIINSLTANVGESTINYIEPLMERNTKRHKVVAGVIRNNGTGWDFIINERHQGDLNCVDASTDENGYIVVDYSAIGAKKVVSLLVAPDETFASLGYIVGASVGLDLCRIKVEQYFTNCVGGHITADNNGNFTIDSNNNIGLSAVSWDSTNSRLTITHSSISNAYPAFTPGLYGRYIIRLYSQNATSTTIEFWDANANAKVTDISTKMSFWFSRVTMGLSMRQVRAENIVNENGNFWFIGIFEV